MKPMKKPMRKPKMILLLLLDISVMMFREHNYRLSEWLARYERGE